MPNNPLSLAEAMELVRTEIAKAQHRAEVLGEEMRFKVSGIEIEFLVQITRERGTDGKLSLGVLEVGAAGKSGRSDTHRIMFTLEPLSTTTIKDQLPLPPPRPAR